jgi:D-glycero-D-manno-heptose 1,7-bisphosphate phosphatase
MPNRLLPELLPLDCVVPQFDPSDRTRPALLLDRDGVLNVDAGYVGRFQDIRWIPGAMETLAVFAKANWHICVVTNQSGIARGYFTEQEVEVLHAQMKGAVSRFGGRIDAFYYCPYHADSRTLRYRVANHPDRKPNPGMLLKALTEHHADAARSIMVGDKLDDLEAARRAGVRPIHYNSPTRLDDFLSMELARDFVGRPF